MYQKTISDALIACYNKYEGTRVEKILIQMEYAIFISVRTGMCTPYPRFYNDNYSVERHIDRVIGNTMRIVDDLYDDLIYEMFMTNHRVRKIQSFWKRAVSNPDYKVCRDRLMKEWTELKSVFEAQPCLGRQVTAITA